MSEIFLTDSQRESIAESKRQDAERRQANLVEDLERNGTYVAFHQSRFADGTLVNPQLYVLIFNHRLCWEWHKDRNTDKGFHIGYIDPEGNSFRWLAGLRRRVEMPAGRSSEGPISSEEAAAIERMALDTRDKMKQERKENDERYTVEAAGGDIGSSGATCDDSGETKACDG